MILSFLIVFESVQSPIGIPVRQYASLCSYLNRILDYHSLSNAVSSRGAVAVKVLGHPAVR